MTRESQLELGIVEPVEVLLDKLDGTPIDQKLTRLPIIDAKLYCDGRIDRRFICTYGLVTPATASRDMRIYTSIAKHNVCLDRGRGWVRAKGFVPQFFSSVSQAEGFLSALLVVVSYTADAQQVIDRILQGAWY